MPYRSRKVDLSLLPDSPEKSSVIHIAEKYNAFVDDVSAMKVDLDQISGATPEEKADTHKAMGTFRKLMKMLHGHRFNLGFILVQVYVVVGIAKAVGLSPEQGKHLIELLFKILEKIAAQ